MNPEIRFRVPTHVLELAKSKAEDLGLETKSGRTGGVSEFARAALYSSLGLALPSDMHHLQQEAFARVRSVRKAQTNSPVKLRVDIHHRVDDKFRKAEALRRGVNIPSRQTSVFEFPQGELPHFLVPYLTVCDQGIPYVEINLEGRLSPRPHAQGELVTAQEHATLVELDAALKRIRREKAKRKRELAEREEHLRLGQSKLKIWSQIHGSELLRARIDNGFEWVSLANREHAELHLRSLEIEDFVPLELSVTLAPSQSPYRNVRPQTEPTLASIEALQTFQEMEETGLKFSLVLCEDESHQTLEAVAITIATPLPDPLHYLHLIQE